MDRWKALFWGSFIPLLVVQSFVLVNDIYWTLTFADNVLHYMWGLCIFLFFVAYLRWKPLDALLGVVVWQILWEGMEMVGDKLFNEATNSLHADHFFFDGIADTLVNIGGALTGWVLIHYTGEPFYERRVAKLRYWFALLCVSMVPLIIIGAPIAVSRNNSPDAFATLWILFFIAATALYTRFRNWPEPTMERRNDKNPSA
jgi:hypothetical protein